MATAKTKTRPTQFGQTFPGSYPPEMRRQLWPLCCGAAIISGFKDVATMNDDELVDQIEHTITGAIPDFQVFAGEQMRPKFTFLTLNQGQAASPKITNAIAKAGFFLIGTGAPRGGMQHFYLRDDTAGTWKPTSLTKESLAPAKGAAKIAA